MAQKPEQFLGPNELSDTYQQILNSAIALPENVQRQLLEWISSAYRREYGQVFPEDQGLSNYEQVMRGQQWGNQRRQITERVINTPLAGFGNSNLLPKVNTLGGAIDALTRSMIPGAAEFVRNTVMGINTASKGLPQSIPTFVDMLNTQMSSIMEEMPFFDTKLGTNVTSFLLKVGGLGGTTRAGRVEPGIRGQTSLDAMNSDMISTGITEQDPTVMPVFDIFKEGSRIGLKLNYLFSPGGRILNSGTEFYRSSNDLSSPIPTGYKNVVVSPDELTALSPLLQRRNYFPEDINQAKLLGELRSGYAEFNAQNYDRSSDPIMYTVDEGDAWATFQKRAALNAPNRIPTNLYYAERDYRRRLNPNMIAPAPNQFAPSQLYLTQRELQQYSGMEPAEGMTGGAIAVIKEARRLVKQLAVSPLPASTPPSVGNPDLAEDEALNRGMSPYQKPPEEYLVKAQLVPNPKGGLMWRPGYTTTYAPDNLRDPNVEPNPNGESTRAFNYTPYGEPLGRTTGTYVEGIDYTPRPGTPTARSQEIDRQLSAAEQQLARTAAINPAQRQAVDNLLRTGKTGMYRNDLPPEEQAANNALYDQGYQELKRAEYIRRYTDMGYSLEKAQAYADQKVARLATRSQTAVNPPENFGGAPNEPAPFYAAIGPSKTPQEIEILAKRLNAYPEDVQKAIKVLMTEYPEYVQSHLGKDKTNAPAFESWKQSLTDEQRTRFEENWNIAFADQQSQRNTGAGAIRFMLDTAGKQWERPNPLEARAQQPRWIGTAVEGSIYINPEVKLMTVNEVVNSVATSQNPNPAFLTKMLSTKTDAVFAHEAGHLRLADLDPKLRQVFIEIFEAEKKAGNPLASGYDPQGATAEEEFAQQNMLFQMGGSKDRRWKNFQAKHFGRFADFFEDIKNEPVMKKAYRVVMGRPGEFGAMSVTYDPNNPTEAVRAFLGGDVSALPNGLASLSGHSDDDLALFFERAGKTQAEVRQLISQVRAAATGTTQVPPAPVNTTPPPAPISTTARPGTSLPTPNSTIPDWVGNVAGERARWNAMSPQEQAAFYTRQNAYHAQGYTPADEFNSSSPEIQNLSLNYAASKGYINRWAGDASDNSYQLSHTLSNRAAPQSNLQARNQQTAMSWGEQGEARINMQAASRVNTPQLGAANITYAEQTDASGVRSRQIEGIAFNRLDQSTVADAVGAMRRGWDAATSSPLPDDNQSAAKSIGDRLNKFINKYVEDYIKKADEAGVDPVATRETAANLKTFMGSMAYDVTKEAGRAKEGGTEYLRRSHDQGIFARSADELERLGGRVPQVAAFVNQRWGGDYRAAAGGPTTTIYDSTGTPINFGQGSWQGVPEGPVGGGYGAGRGGTPSARGMWAGKIGSAMYGAYIAKRMWSMTIGPMLQEEQLYGEGMNITERVASAGGMGSQNLITSDAGWATRQAMTQQYYAKAAYQEWGGLSNFGYSLTGDGGTLGRLTSIGQVSAGAVGVGGAVAGMARMGLMGTEVAGAAGAIGTAGLIIGGGILAGGIAMEAHNIAYPEAPKWTYGGLFEDIGQYYTQYQGAARAERAGVAKISMGSRIQQAREDYDAGKINYGRMLTNQLDAIFNPVSEYSSQTRRQYLNPQERAYLDIQEPTEAFKRTETALNAFQSATSEKKETMGGSFATLARGTSAMINDEGFRNRVAASIKESGYTTNEWTSQFTQYSTAMGFIPGTPGYQNALNAWSAPGLSEGQRQGMLYQGQQIARYSGAVSGYYNQLGEAQADVRAYKIDSQPKAQAMQSLLAVAGMGGLSGSDVIGYLTGGPTKGRGGITSQAYTVGDWTAQMSSVLGVPGSQMAAQIAGNVVAAGGSPEDALNQAASLVSKVGLQGAQWANQAGSAMLQAGAAPGGVIAASQRIAQLGYAGYQGSMQMGGFLAGTGMDTFQAYGAYGNYGYSNMSQVSAMQGAVQTAQTFALPGVRDYGQASIASAYGGISGFAGQMVNNMAPSILRAGMSGFQLAGIAQQVGGRGNQFAYMANAIIGGDIGAMSYASYYGMGDRGSDRGYGTGPTGQGNMAWRFTDRSGNPIYETDMSSFMRFGQAQAAQGNWAAINAFQRVNANAPLGDQINQMLTSGGGTALSGDALSALMQGTRQYTLQHNATQFGFQMAGVGVGYAKIAEQRNYLWGAGAGGTWDNPTAGSSWGLENQQRAMSYQQQMYQFGYQSQMMQTQNYFAGQQEQLSYARMGTTQAYQRWQSAFEYSGMQQQRGWTREDWQYQDTMTQLQFGWNMEDISEGLRYAKGRERKDLLKQRERAVLTENLTEGQTETVRSRQEQQWAREDERYQKQTQYSEQMMKFDTEQFELSRRQRMTLYNMEKENLSHSIEEYKKEFALQEQIITLNREHQMKSLELEEQSLGIQAAAALESKTYSDNMTVISQNYSDISGAAERIMKYDPSAVIDAFSAMAINFAEVNISTINGITSITSSLNDLNASSVLSIVNLVTKLNSLDPTRMNQLVEILGYLDNP